MIIAQAKTKDELHTITIETTNNPNLYDVKSYLRDNLVESLDNRYMGDAIILFRNDIDDTYLYDKIRMYVTKCEWRLPEFYRATWNNKRKSCE